MSVVLPKGMRLCREAANWYTLDRIRGKKRAKITIKLFRMNHSSLESVFKDIRSSTVKFLKLLFINNKSGSQAEYTKVLEMLARDYLTRNGYDGAVLSRKFSSAHGKPRIFITRPGSVFEDAKIGPRRVIRHPSLQEMFVRYTSRTKGLQRAYGKQMIIFLSGGMAIKLYLGARRLKIPRKVADTSDFDFKFAVPRPVRAAKDIETYSYAMKRIMTRHMIGFVKHINSQWNLGSSLIIKEVKGVPVDKAGGRNIKKVYKVFNFAVKLGSRSPAVELVDTSLVNYPSINREHLNLKFSRFYGMGIPKLKYLWKDTLHILAGSFVTESMKLRNPINGNKKEKGLKNTHRIMALSNLITNDSIKQKSNKLIANILGKNKTAGTRHAKQIIAHLNRNHVARA